MWQVDFYFNNIRLYSYLTGNVGKTDIYLYLSGKSHLRLNPQLKMAVEKSKSEQRSLYVSKLFHRKSFFCFHSNFFSSGYTCIVQLPKPTSENSKIKTKFSSGAYLFIISTMRVFFFHECNGA